MLKGLILLQARTGSTRLPNKVLLPLNHKPMIQWQIDRILSSEIAPLVVATTSDTSDDVLVDFLNSLNVETFRGSINNVFERFSDILRINQPDYFIRLTADCPLFMPDLLRKMTYEFLNGDYEYYSNTLETSFPDGLDIEIIRTEAFFRLTSIDLTEQQREHVTLGIYQNPDKFKIGNFKSDLDLSNMRWTVDYLEDYQFVCSIYEKIKGRELTFNTKDILDLLDSGVVANNSISPEFRNIALKQEE